MATLTDDRPDLDNDIDPDKHPGREPNPEFDEIAKNFDKDEAEEPEPGFFKNKENENDGEKPNRRKRAGNFLRKHKKLLIGGGGGVAIGGAMFVLFLLGSLVVPNLAAHMMVYGFARAAQDTADSVVETDATNTALNNADDGAFRTFINDIKDSIKANTPDTVGNVINKFQTYNQKRPANVWKNLKTDVEYHYTDTKSSIPLGNGQVYQRQRIDYVTVKGVRYNVPTNLTNVKSFSQNPLQYFKDAYSNTKGVKAVLTDSTSSGVLGKIGNYFVRGRVMNSLREEIDAKLYRWNIKNLQDDSKANAATAQAEDTVVSYEETTGGGASTEAGAASTGNQIQQGAEAAQQAVEECATDVNCVKNGKILTGAVNKLNTIYSSSLAQKALSNFSTAYAILVPLCLMYQASIKNSGTVINTNVANAQRSFVSFAAAADQQKTGAVGKTQVVNAQAIGGLADNLTKPTGDNALEDSAIEQKARGQNPDTTASSDLETGGDGQHTYTDIFNTFLPSLLAASFSKIVTPTCDVLANVWSGAALGIVQLGAAVIPGLGEVVDGGGQLTARAVAVILTKNLVKTAQTFLSKKELLKLGAITTVTVGGSILAKVTAAHAASINMDGTAQGLSEADFLAQGALTLAGDYDRQQNCAVPLTGQQIQQLNGTTTPTSQSASIMQRYFALHNPNSLINNMGVSLALHLRANSISTMFSSTVQALNPMRALSRLAAAIHPAIVSAATPYSAVAQDYGLVQFGWPVDQESAYTGSSTYGMITNQLILDQSGMAEQISAKYGKCFSEPVGTMISSGDVQLDDQANVIHNLGDCSPDNLGMNNCSFKYQGKCDIVFRYRVACRNNNAQNDLLDTQSPTPSTQKNT